MSQSSVLDLGCGTGIATVAALARGAHVVAIDPDEEALRELLVRTPKAQYPRLQVRVGRLPDLNFKHAHFSAVHVSRCCTFSTATGCVARSRIFPMVVPGGQALSSALSPVGPYWIRSRPNTHGAWSGGSHGRATSNPCPITSGMERRRRPACICSMVGAAPGTDRRRLRRRRGQLRAARLGS